MTLTRLLAAAWLAGVSTAALAGDEILYAPAPAWVDVKEVDANAGGASPLLLVEQQVRLEDGTVANYSDMAIRLASPEALTQIGTLTAQWMPDKGDLTIHRVELIRGSETIDVLGEGARFEALRRERQLERRIVDGARTATLALPGARLGDVVRLAYTVTNRDQALGSEMQWQGMLVAEPIPLARGSVTVSWPEDEAIGWLPLRGAAVREPVARDGYRYLSVAMPIAKPADMPDDAPLRYLMPSSLQVGSFADWREVSAVMAPHYLGELAIEPGSVLEEQVRRIERRTRDPLERAALATQLVQDQISYLLDGMNGGNYIPQSAAETWQQRYGDCKAKSVLLAALLRAMDIDAELLIVRSSGGDALPELLPMPGNFDHVIVHAVIGGTDYWLDGTASGTRLANIATVPPFHYGLPLREGGADLLPLVPRLPPAPEMTLSLTIDSSAGVAVPAFYDVDLAMAGASGGPIRAVAGQIEGKMLDQMVNAMVASVFGPTQILSRDIAYDEATGVAHVRAKGVMTTPWERKKEVYQLEPPGQPGADLDFSADRARAAWRDIPLRLNGPNYLRLDLTVELPDDGKGFSVEGSETFSERIAGIAVESKSQLTGGRFTLRQESRVPGGELAAGDIAAAKRDGARLQRLLPTLRAPGDARRAWQYAGSDRKLLGRHERAYAQLIEQADEDEIADAYLNRANFRYGTLDFAGAKADLDKAIEHQASTWLYFRRAGARSELGDLEGSLADLREAEALEATGQSYASQIELLGLLGRVEEGLALAEDYEAIAENETSARQLMATALMWAGRPEQGLAILAEAAAKRPGDSGLLNAQCWEAGIWHQVAEDLLQVCTRAVEKSDWAAPALDSRAMAYYRLGRYDDARADLDAVVDKAPELAASRYMRGVVRLAQGDKRGRDDIDLALRMQPSLARTYAAYGIEP